MLAVLFFVSMDVENQLFECGQMGSPLHGCKLLVSCAQADPIVLHVPYELTEAVAHLLLRSWEFPLCEFDS